MYIRMMCVQLGFDICKHQCHKSKNVQSIGFQETILPNLALIWLIFQRKFTGTDHSISQFPVCLLLIPATRRLIV
jgi:hypothetical protein